MRESSLCFLIGAVLVTSMACSGEALTPEPDQAVRIQHVEEAPKSDLLVFEHAALDRVGCRASTTYSVESLQLFLAEIEKTSNFDAASARLELSAVVRALGCMSASDFSVNYTRIMDLITSSEPSARMRLRLAPLVLVFTEYGSILIDDRAHRWIMNAQSVLLEAYEHKGVWADDIGFFSLRGTTPVLLLDDVAYELIRSVDSKHWLTRTCTISSTIFLPRVEDSAQVDPVCLLDPCPRVSISDHRTFGAYQSACASARESLDASLNVSGGGASSAGGSASGGLGGSLAAPNSGAVGAVLECMAAYSSGSTARYTGCVQAIANRRPVTSIETSVSLITTMRPRGCSNPLADGDGEASSAALEANTVEADALAKRIEELEEALDDYSDYRELCEAAGGDLESLDCQIAAELAGTLGFELGLDSDEPDFLESLIEAIRELVTQYDELVDEIRQGEYEKKLSDEDFRSGIREPINSPLQVCDGEAGCSSTCGIREQFESFLGDCVGSVPSYDSAPTLEEPGYDPTVAYPTPDDVVGSGEFAELSDCIAKALGHDVLVENPELRDDDLCERIQCSTTSRASLELGGDCSCGSSGAPAAIAEMGGWQGAKDQCAYVSCDGESSCGCHGFASGPVVELPFTGQGPSDPTVFLVIDDPVVGDEL